MKEKHSMDFSGNTPIFQQIAELICEKILREEWKAGDKIPSVREIAVLTEVNPNTAMRSIVTLQEQEILFNKRGIGYFVADDGKQKVLNFKRKDFKENNAPLFFKNMELLNISIQEIEELYKAFKNNKKNIDSQTSKF